MSSTETTSQIEVTVEANSNSADVATERLPQEFEREEVVFTTNDNDDIVADNNNPTAVELRTVPSRLRKTVSFSVLPAIDSRNNLTTSTTSTTNRTPQQRRPLMKSSKSLPRLDLSSGLLHYHDKNKENHTKNDGIAKPFREQLIQTITKIVPAGENSNIAATSARTRWSKLRQSVLNQATTPYANDTKQSSDVGESINEETPSRTFPTTTTTSATTATTNPTHHYRIRSRHAHDPSFWILQTEIMAGVISRYVTWTYRSSFYVTIISSYIVFMGIMILFALGIYLSAVMQPSCIFVGGSNQFSGHFMDAVHLSWTTLSSTGYGIVGPEIPDTNRRCIVINLLMAFESFVGVLFGGFASAIIIGKIARFQSIAHIFFSDMICIKYGTAAALDVDDEDDDANIAGIGGLHSDETTSNNDSNQHPFPILEFRMINALSRERGGEILNAHVTVVASVLYDDCESTRHIESLKVRNLPSYPSDLVHIATETTSQAAKLVGTVGTIAATSTVKLTGAALLCAKKLTTGGTGSAFQQLVHQVRWTPKEMDPTLSDDSEPLQRELDLMTNEAKQDIRQHIFVDEGNSILAPPRTYHRLQVETDRHPYFKRVWNIRHVLNENSPLLSDQARNLIRSNYGQWPANHSNAASIRKHLRFNDIIISFSGTANASGRTVYTQKVYAFSDICIGYTFANVLTLENHRIVVDSNMLNEIREQIGGGAERRPKSEQDDGSTLFNIVSRNVGTAVKGIVRQNSK